MDTTEATEYAYTHTHQRTLLETSPLEFARNPPLGVLRRAAHKKVSHQRHSAAKPPEGFSRAAAGHYVLLAEVYWKSLALSSSAYCRRHVLWKLSML